MKLSEVLNTGELLKEIARGYVRMTEHPNMPLAIFNYTEKAQFARRWNDVTKLTRGLIVNTANDEVVARPFPKFFNYEEDREVFSLDEPVVVTDKLDGSLGILYPTGRGSDRYAVATRGSFTSDQAIHASKLWREKYEDEAYWLSPELTYLFEIIYPQNRIVVDYGGLDDLVLLGAVDKRSGHVYGPDEFPAWSGPRARVFHYRTLREAVQARPRAGKEGLVVRSRMDNRMVKLKQQDYVELHRIVTGLNEKEIWRRAMKADIEQGSLNRIVLPDAVLDGIPDELHDWVRGVAWLLADKIHLLKQEAYRAYMQALPSQATGLDERAARRRYALQIQDHPAWLQKTLWLLYDGKDPLPFLWKQVEPKGDVRK
jgi:RNA ligase